MSGDEDDPDGPVWRRRLHNAIREVRLWEPVFQQQPEVHPKSDMAGDDTRWPMLPVSTLAWVGLSSAVEHLGLFADDMQRVLAREGPLRPQAPFTLTRSALIGASQAVWLLCDDDRETRVRRGFSVASHEDKDYADFMGDYIKDESIRDDVGMEMVDELAAVFRRVSERRRDISLDPPIWLMPVARGDRRMSFLPGTMGLLEGSMSPSRRTSDRCESLTSFPRISMTRISCRPRAWCR